MGLGPIPSIDLLDRLRLAMHDILRSGEFAHWVATQEMPFAAVREYNELLGIYAEWCRQEPGKCFCGAHKADLF